MKRFVVALLALALPAVPATSCSSGTSEESGPAVSSSTPRSPAPKPVAHLGETLDLNRIGEGKIAVTLEQIINPATVPNGEGDPGKNYLATTLTITNTGSQTIVGNANSNVAVVGSDNHTYAADFATVVECKNFSYGWFLLPPGVSVTGCVTFGLPPGITPVKVKYMPSSGISRDVGEWLST